ncbi:MAG TPA: hypothetical protein VJV75_02105 [Candidatus Polarisedimenticolia bacterium]|nr:hypothetical protein [Candidatus Polarisedimenticolia bacterium]
MRHPVCSLLILVLSSAVHFAGPASAEETPVALPAADPAPATPSGGASPWRLAWHGYAFLDSNRQGGPSGGRDFESINHFMVMAERPLGAWTMELLGTFSLEPATVAPEGSPLLFQRGETYGGNLLIDKQHAHDLFVQLAAAWSRPLTEATSLRLYAGLRGEPAVGPEAYPHRLSASENPSAPLAHHNLDSTHISDDVVSAGWISKIVTVEGSLFHGEEPDEDRWDLDQGALDSYAGRITVRPIDGLSFQASACRREDPEALEEGNQTRVTASVSWEKRWRDGFIAALAAAGENRLPEDAVERGSLVEATWNLRTRHFLYGRAERVDRDVYELTNKTQRPETVAPDTTQVSTLSLGYSYTVPLLDEAETAVGALVDFYRFDRSLEPVYGDSPVSFWAYLRFRFGSAGGHAHHH